GGSGAGTAAAGTSGAGTSGAGISVVGLTADSTSAGGETVLSIRGGLGEGLAVVEPEGGQLGPPAAAGGEAGGAGLEPQPHRGPVPEDDHRPGALAAWHREPGQAAGRRLGGWSAEVGAHAALGSQDAQLDEARESGARAPHG